MSDKLSVFHHVWHCGQTVDGTEYADEFGWLMEFKTDCGRVIYVGSPDLEAPITNHELDDYKAHRRPGRYCKGCYGIVSAIPKPPNKRKVSRIEAILSKYKRD